MRVHAYVSIHTTSITNTHTHKHVCSNHLNCTGAPSLSSTESGGSSLARSTQSKYSTNKGVAEVSVLCVDNDEVSQLVVQGLLQQEDWRCVGSMGVEWRRCLWAWSVWV